MAKGTRLSGRASTSEPFPACTIGLRAAQTMTASDKRVLSRESSSDDELLDLARSLVQRCNARVPEVLPDGILVDVTVAAVNLDGGVRRAHGGLAAEVLGHRRLERVRFARIGQGCRTPREQARRLRVDADLGDQLLDELEGADWLAELPPL